MSKKELIELLEQLLGPLSQMVLRQIDKYATSGITYKEIARAVYYLFDVQGRDKSSVSTYGIGLVPNVLQEANIYYDQIKQQQEKQVAQAKRLQKIKGKHIVPEKRNHIKKGIDIDGL